MSYDGYDEDDLEFDNDSDDPRNIYDFIKEETEDEDWDDEDWDDEEW